MWEEEVSRLYHETRLIMHNFFLYTVDCGLYLTQKEKTRVQTSLWKESDAILGVSDGTQNDQLINKKIHLLQLSFPGRT